MKEICFSFVCLIIAALACVPVVAQETAEADDSPPDFEEAVPITLPVELEGDQKNLRIELVVHRWSDRGQQDEGGQRFTVSVKEQPPFMENLRWEEGPEIEFAPGEHSKTLPLIFDTAVAGVTGEPTEDGKLVLLIEARHEAVIPPERELEIPLHFKRALQPGDAAISVCALREDAPEEFPVEQAFEFCDPERQPVVRSDRIVLFFTPARDLSEPIGEDQYFLMRVHGPNGDQLITRPFWNKGSAEQPELSLPFTVEGSPGRFAIPLSLWNIRDDPDPARARTGPGTYTVKTVDARIAGSAVFGQGDATPYIDGEWRDEGTFEIGALRPVFAGFVAEDVNDLPLPPGTYPGALTIGKPQVSGSSVSIEMRARWRRRPEEPEQSAVSRLSLEFPPELTPDYEQVGAIDATLEILQESEDSFALFFTAGVHNLVTTNTAPPDRHLVEGNAIPKFWEPLVHKPADCSGGTWIWTQGAGNQFFEAEPTEGRCTIKIEHFRGDRESRFGDPERRLASHLHDSTTLWAIPVFYSLVDARTPWSGSQKVNVRSYGYALYAAQPYTGPGPAGQPPSGDAPGDEISDVTPGPGSGPGGGDTGSGTSTTATTGTGPATGPGTGPGSTPGPGPGTGTGTPLVPPPTIDPSNPGGLDPDRQPLVANMIREWLTIAQPPENAVPGVHFQYDQFGRKIGGGGATGRTIRTHDTVEYGSGASSEAKVWSALRTQLDSIDHCILEEYVIARLQEQAIDHCRGRYGAIRDLAGVPLGEARSEVEGAGFTVGPSAPGSPAPTPEASGTVERQEPSPAQHLRRGQEVTLVVHAPHVPSAILAPDVVDLSRMEAKRRLEERSLVAGLQGGSPARTPEESDTVESQQPMAGTPLQAGETVVLRVRTNYVATSTIPDVLGMSTGDAKAALIAAGVRPEAINLIGGSSAPSAALAGRVETQEPAAGWTVESGGTVVLKVHSGFVDARTVPSVIGMTGAAATQSLAAAGLGVQQADGPPAQSQSTSGTVFEQSPAAGSSVMAGTVVQLSVHRPYVPPAPTPSTGNRATGNPPLQCPESVMTTKRLGGTERWIPAGTRVALDRAKSGFDLTDRSRIVHFTCTYGANGITGTLARARWVPNDATLPYIGLCGGEDGKNMLGTTYLYVRGYQAMVQVFDLGLDRDEGMRVGGEFIRQLKDYSKPCGGSAPPTVTPTPATVPPTPAPSGSCHIQEYPGRGPVTLLFEQRLPGGHVNVSIYSIPTESMAVIEQHMASSGLRLVSRHSNYQDAKTAAQSICSSATGNRSNTPPPRQPPPSPPKPPPPPAAPACPGPEVTPIYELWNQSPYTGLGGLVCRDRAGKMWINVSNNIHSVSDIQLGAKQPEENCWWGTKVVSPGQTYEGRLCQK